MAAQVTRKLPTLSDCWGELWAFGWEVWSRICRVIFPILTIFASGGRLAFSHSGEGNHRCCINGIGLSWSFEIEIAMPAYQRLVGLGQNLRCPDDFEPKTLTLPSLGCAQWSFQEGCRFKSVSRALIRPMNGKELWPMKKTKPIVKRRTKNVHSSDRWNVTVEG